MTTPHDRDPDRKIRAWLDLMPATVPDRAIDDLLDSVANSPQDRTTPVLIRTLGRLSGSGGLLAAAAVIVAIAGLTILGGRPLGIGLPLDRQTDPPSMTYAPTPTTSSSPAPVSAALAGTWIADRSDDIAFEDSTATGRLSLALEANGMSAFVSLTDDPAIRLSAFAQAIDNERIRFDARPSSAVIVDGQTLRPCATDESGIYRYLRSADGSMLTLIAESDPCASRSAVLARTWVRSLGAPNLGGNGVIDAFDPLFSVTLPSGNYVIERHPDAIMVVQALPEFQFHAFKEPQGFLDPCDIGAGRFDIAPGADAVRAYFEQLDGFTVDSTTEMTVDGYRALRIVLRSDLDAACPAAPGWRAQWQPKAITSTQHWRVLPGVTDSLIVVELPETTLMFEVLPAPHALESEVIGSIRFPETLPTEP